MKENNPHILGTEKVGKLLLEYSIPMMAGIEYSKSKCRQK